MKMMFGFRAAALVFPFLAFAGVPLPAAGETSVFLREDWAETPAETPVTQAHVVNPGLILSLHGLGKDGIKKSHHDKPADDPWYIWSGTAEGNWAVSLRRRDALADLSGPAASVRWRAKQSGFRELHIIIQLADGAWLVSEESDGLSADWREQEFRIANLHWRKLDIAKIVESGRVEKPDLSRVREIGWTDLMTGGGTPASSRLDWIEVRARAVNSKSE